MEIVTKNFKANKEGKLDADMVSELRPIEGHDEVVVKFKHLSGGEINKYIDANTRDYDFTSMFRKKVISIEGIDLKDEDGNKIDVTPEVLTIVACPLFDNIIYKTCGHLIESYTMTKEEEKNLNGDSRL